MSSKEIITAESEEYIKAKADRDALEAEVNRHQKALNLHPKEANGMTPDHVKNTPKFQEDKKRFNQAFNKLRDYNATFVKKFKSHIAADQAKRFKTEQEIIAESIWLTEDEAERQKYIQSLQLKPGEHDLSDKELHDFAGRSHAFKKFPGSPAHHSAERDVEAMSPNRLKQVIAHPKVNVFYKHKARKRLSGEWK